MDKFEEIYRIQEEFTKRFFKDKHNLSLEDIKNDRDKSIYWNKEYILSLTKEVYEMLDELDWKMHVSKDTQDIEDNFLEEGIDALKYLIGLLQINGFTAEQIFDKFIDKSKVVEAKFEQEKLVTKLKAGNEQIVFVDVDGVLASWPGTFIEFVNERKGTDFKSLPELVDGLDRKEFYVIKSQYRLSGIKRKMKVLEGSREFLTLLKKKDYKIILLTARPYKKIFRIYSDTLSWLKENELPFDAILWNEEKEKYIIEHFDKEQVAFCVDDDISNANKLANFFQTFLIPNRKAFYNKEHEEKSLIQKVSDKVTTFNNINQLTEWLEIQK